MGVCIRRKMSGLIILAAFLLMAKPSTGLAQSVKTVSVHQSDRISLAGIWRFELDPLGEGNEEPGDWHEKKLPGKITLPGSTDQADFGYKTQGMVPWRLNRLYKYKGDAWYSKKVYVPASWKGKDITLFLERAHWKTSVWVNDKAAGSRVSLSTPDVYDITSLIKPGQENLIMIMVDNNMIYNIGYGASAITEDTQTNWNGLIGKLELTARDKVHIGSVQVYPEVAQKAAKVVVRIINRTKEPIKGSLMLGAQSYNTKNPEKVSPKSVDFSGSDSAIVVSTQYPMGNHVELWDEFHPTLYRLTTSLAAVSGDQHFSSRSKVSFGMRDFTTKGTQFVINGHPTMIRGTLNCAPFPITGYPPMNVKQWMRIFGIAKTYGQNSMRFHSWCPPKAAFEAADRMGFYLQISNPYWDPRTCGSDPKVNKFITNESQRILKTYGNHPSFTMFVAGNELGGPKVIPFLTKLVTSWKKEDPRHLYASSAGYPQIPENNFDCLYGPRAQLWGAGLKGRFNVGPLSTNVNYSNYVKKYKVPIESHEVGQWCVYPNFKQIPEYTGVVRAYNYELFRKSLRDHHMLNEAHDFLMASGKWQVLEYKEEIEAAIRTPGYGGYQLLGLHDYPGQGTALVGVLDVFWHPKPYVTAKEFHEFQSSRVPLLRTDKFTWTTNENFEGTAEFANYGETSMNNATMHWVLKYPDGNVYASGDFSNITIPQGEPDKIGNLSVPLNRIKHATQLILTLSIDGTNYTNHWSIWVYPVKLTMPRMKGVLVTHQWDRRTERTLERGGKVLLLAEPTQINSNVPPGLSSIFWNTNWTHGQAPHTLGILCNPKNPALTHFPTQYYTNWQWWDIVDHSRPMILDQMPPNLIPDVQMIDDWNKNHKIGLVFEARVGKGKLLMTSVDLEHNMANRPVARQMLYSLERYVTSDQFNPKVSVKPSEITMLFKKEISNK